MSDKNPFDFIGDEFRRAGIIHLLIGGYAVNYYKVTRQTADIDFLIATKDLSKIEMILKKFGYQKKSADTLFARFQSDKYLMDLDFLFVDEETLEGLIKEGAQINIAGNKYILPSLTHLIALKLHAIKSNPEREYRDLPDIINLVKKNHLDSSTAPFRELCLKYGTKQIYEKIKTASR
ncbi:MAG: nucleotidyltransferase family protein [Candidatus Aureabacteria bacterium]|nr:nucleotidyltransferase family protein [Candidatus Auribacterota bacterium]